MRKWILILLLIPSSLFGQASYDVINVNYKADNLNFTTGNGAKFFNLVLIGNVNTSGLNGGSLGMEVIFNVCQDGVGGRTFNWPPNVINPPPINLPANSCTVTRFVNIGNFQWTNTGVANGTGGTTTSAAGVPPQTQVNDPGNPGHFGGTPCENFPSLTVGPINADCDWHSKGPNPWLDITRFGARAFTGTPQSTTASCNGTTSVTLTSAIDFINGDGIVLHQCGPATALSTPAAPASVTPKGILNGATTRCYEIVAEDTSLGMTAASTSTCTTTAASGFGSTSTNLTSCTENVGILSCTSAANHNLENGEAIQLAGTTATGGSLTVNGVYFVQTTPSATTFTALVPGKNRTDININTIGGTVAAPAHIWVKWAINGTTTMRYWVYRQDGGAGAFNLVGPAQGVEPFFDDYNFAAPTRTPEVPATAPSVATNQALATTIVSGAGTTSIVVANAASSTVSGISALHDNTVAYRAAISAAQNTNAGGSIFVPNIAGGSSFPINFPLVLPPISNNSIVKHIISGTLKVSQPIFSSSGFTEFLGFSPNNYGNPSFSGATYGTITGIAYPLMLLSGVSSFTLDHMALTTDNNSSQQWGLIADENTVGGGWNTIHLYHCYLTAFTGTGFPAVLRGGGFGFHAEDTVFVEAGIGGNDYFYKGGLRMMSGKTTPAGMPSIGELRDVSFVGAQITMDGDSVGPSNGPQTWVFEHIFSESTCMPFISARNINIANWNSWIVRDVVPADIIGTCGPSSIMDLSSPTVGGLRGLDITQVGTTNLNSNTAGIISTTTDVNAIYNIGSYAGESTGSACNTILFSPCPQPTTILDTSGGLRLLSSAPVFAQGGVPTSVTGVVQAGGSLPIGTFPINVTAEDWNGGETSASASIYVTTSTGNQQVLVSWTAVSPAPQAYFVYFNSVRQGTVINATSVTLSTFGGATSMPFGSLAGPTGMSLPTGVWTNNLRVTSGAFKTDVSDAALTANRTAVWPDASGVNIVSSYQNSAYDNFNRANGGLGSNWTTVTGESALAISSNQVVGGTAAVVNHQFWSATAYGNDEFAQATITTVPTGADQIGVTARVSTTARIYYLYRCTTVPARDLMKNVNGTFTVLATVAAGCSVGDVLKLQVSGNTQTAFRNGVQDLTASDTAIPTGANVGMFTVGTTGVADNWSGGNLHPIAQLDTEQDWTQPQHFTQPVTIGPTNPIAGALPANMLFVPYVATDGGTPTCSGTGTGTGATCGTFQPQADDESGQFLISTGTTPGAAGTVTLIFNITSTRLSYCIFMPSNTGGANWNARATFFPTTSGGGSNNQAAWDNNGVNLTGSTTYGVTYICGRH